MNQQKWEGGWLVGWLVGLDPLGTIRVKIIRCMYIYIYQIYVYYIHDTICFLIKGGSISG